MNLQVTLRCTSSNKHRRVSSEDVVCCLEVPNELLCHWQKSKQKNIVKSIAESGIKRDEHSKTVEPLLADVSGPGSLEERMQTRGRILLSTLSQLSRKKKKSLLSKSILIDVRTRDIVP
uniref:Uncharacterized protein n=1 Tax=Amphimedon queenslandica TaxID=400682 RepID=A0A1X7SFA2_AMPQE